MNISREALADLASSKAALEQMRGHVANGYIERVPRKKRREMMLTVIDQSLRLFDAAMQAGNLVLKLEQDRQPLLDRLELAEQMTGEGVAEMPPI
jgi:hypothetical protein